MAILFCWLEPRREAAVPPCGDEQTSPTSEETMTITKPLVATVAILATIGLATAPASARKHHHKMHQSQSEMMNKSKTTTGQSMGQMNKSSGGATNKDSAGMGSSGTGSQASPKQTK
jgi:hypothetical protein